MENKPRTPDEDFSKYEEELIREDLSSKEKESLIEQSKELLGNIIPEALNNDKSKEQTIIIKHDKPQKEVTASSNLEESAVENSPEEYMSKPAISGEFERQVTDKEIDFDKKYEIKGGQKQPLEMPEKQESENYHYPLTPVSEIIKNMKSPSSKVSVKSAPPRQTKKTSMNPRIMFALAGFIAGIICLLILIANS